MSDYNRILELAESSQVKEGIELPKVHLHKWLVLGQTQYLCEYGTLSDGHEKITDAQKYSQAIKEAYYLSLNIQGTKAQAKLAQADVLDAEEELTSAKTPSQTLRAEGRLEMAQSKLVNYLINAEDQDRMLKYYLARAKQLQHSVEAQYPEGIEQAELDNWVAVAKYRSIKEKLPGVARERMDNVPLPPEIKAQLGIAYDRPDMVAPLMVAKENEIRSLPSGSVNEYLGLEVQTENRSDN